MPQDPSKGPNVALNRFSKDRPSPDNGLYYSWNVPGAAFAQSPSARRRFRGVAGGRKPGAKAAPASWPPALAPRRPRPARRLTPAPAPALHPPPGPTPATPFPSPPLNPRPPAPPPGTAHFIALTSYITNDTFSEDTAQYKWFENDLKKVDRKKTPWLIVYFHAPFVRWGGLPGLSFRVWDRPGWGEPGDC